MTNISDKLVTLHELIEQSYYRAKQGRLSESHDLYMRAFLIAENMLKTNHPSVFLESEYEFLNEIIDRFNNE